MENLWIFLAVFIIIFLIDYFGINKRRLNIKNNNGKNKKGKTKKIKDIGELDYLITKFKLDTKKLNVNEAILVIAILNSFIIAFTSTIIVLIPGSISIQLLVAFVVLFMLIYALYEIYGRILKKKEGKVRKKD